jgi:CHAD domain-containing protein
LAYRLDPADPDLSHALRRIARDELDAALTRLGAEGAPDATAVHEVRKHVKKIRGLLRLVRPGFSGFRAETEVLRAAAQSLSGLRDAEVRLATFDKLLARDRPAGMARLRDHLAGARDAATSAPTPAAEARAALSALRHRVGDWKVRGDDADVLTAGLADTRRKARETMALARESRDIDALHEWRKRVKDGWYQARLLTPVWPVVMGPLADQAGLLGEDLGEHHDLGVLSDYLAGLPDSAVGADAKAQAIARAGEAMAALEARMFPLGALLHAGKPEAVARQWVAWWQGWREAAPAT